MMKKITYLICFAGIVMQSCQQKNASDNPLLNRFDTPFEVPPFDKIRDAHYLPAFREGIRQQQEEIDAITSDKATPTFANTIEALEKSGQLLAQVNFIFMNQQAANTSDSINAIAEEIAPELSAHNDAMYLNDKLFERVKTVYDNRANENLDIEQQMVLQQYYNAFIRGGANLSPEDKEKLKKSTANWRC